MSRTNTASSRATSRPAWVAGAPPTGRPPPSAGSPSSSSPSRSAAWSARSTSTRTRPGRASPAASTGSSTPASSSPPPRASSFQSGSLRAGDPAFTAAIEDVVARLSQARGRPERPLAARRRATRARSRRTATRRSSSSTSAATQTTPSTRSTPSSTASPRCSRLIPSSSSASSATRARSTGVDTAFADDLAKAGELSLPVTLIILVFAFGALVAAGIPLLLALTAVFATFGLIALPSQVAPAGAAGARARAPDRPRGRRRLLDVLPPPRTRGARRRAAARGLRSRWPPPRPAARCSSPA